MAGSALKGRYTAAGISAALPFSIGSVLARACTFVTAAMRAPRWVVPMRATGVACRGHNPRQRVSNTRGRGRSSRTRRFNSCVKSLAWVFSGPQPEWRHSWTTAQMQMKVEGVIDSVARWLPSGQWRMPPKR